MFAPRGLFNLHLCYSIGPLILLIFFAMLMVAFVYVYFFIPEVKGLELEEVHGSRHTSTAND
jgi:hypothetical protein